MINFSDTNQVEELFQKAVAKALEKHAARGESVAVSDKSGNVKVLPASEMLDFSPGKNTLSIPGSLDRD